jgi:hypothetical protein
VGKIPNVVPEGTTLAVDRVPPIAISSEAIRLTPKLVPLDGATLFDLLAGKSAFIEACKRRCYSGTYDDSDLSVYSDEMAALLSSGGQLVDGVTATSSTGREVDALEIMRRSTLGVIAGHLPNLQEDLKFMGNSVPLMVVSRRLLKESVEDARLFEEASAKGVYVPPSLLQTASSRMDIDLGSHVNVAYPPRFLADLYSYAHELGHHVERTIRLNNTERPEDMDLAVKDEEVLAWQYADEIFADLTGALGVDMEPYNVMLLRFTALASRFTYHQSEFFSLIQDYNRRGRWGGLEGERLSELVRVLRRSERLGERVHARISERSFDISGVREEDFLAAYDVLERYFTALNQGGEVTNRETFEFADRRSSIEAGDPSALQDLQGFLILHYYGEQVLETRTASSLGDLASGYVDVEPVGSFLVRSGVYSKLRPMDAILASGRKSPFFVEVADDKGGKWISIRNPREFVEFHFCPFATLNNVENPELTLPMLAMCVADFRSLLEILNNTRKSDRPDHVVTYAATKNSRIVNLARKMGFGTARVHYGGSDSDQTILYVSIKNLLEGFEQKTESLDRTQAIITRRGWSVERARKLAITSLAKNIVN